MVQADVIVVAKVFSRNFFRVKLSGMVAETSEASKDQQSESATDENNTCTCTCLEWLQKHRKRREIN